MSSALHGAETAGALQSTLKASVIFSLDQAFPNGPVANHDLKSLQNTMNCVKSFSKKYEAYALFAGDVANKRYLQDALDLLMENQIPFVLDAASSDAIVMDAGTAPYDRSHGLELSVGQLQKYKNRYGSYFRGIRFFELFAEHWTIWASKARNENWVDNYREHLPKDDFYQTSLIEPYVRFAADNHMFLVFSDWFWYFDHRWVPDAVGQQQHENELKSLMRRFPKVIIAVYNNNEPMGYSRDVKWIPAFDKFRSEGAKGFGLSDQAWLCEDEIRCPVNELSNMAVSALRGGAMLIQTEPYWYWWKYPTGELNGKGYLKFASSTQAGRPNGTLQKFASALGIGKCD